MPTFSLNQLIEFIEIVNHRCSPSEWEARSGDKTFLVAFPKKGKPHLETSTGVKVSTKKIKFTSTTRYTGSDHVEYPAVQVLERLSSK